MRLWTGLVVLALAACGGPKAAEPAQEPEQRSEAPATPQPDLSAKYKPAPAGEITVRTPLANARSGSPLVAEGVANNDWFFEGQFVAELMVDGEIIAQAPAMQAGDTSWTDPGPVNFKAELAFDVAKETAAELILSEDMPAYIDEANDIRGPARSVRIPVTLLPKAQ